MKISLRLPDEVPLPLFQSTAARKQPAKGDASCPQSADFIQLFDGFYNIVLNGFPVLKAGVRAFASLGAWRFAQSRQSSAVHPLETTCMFVDERIYTLHAGQVPTFLKLYEEEGMECQVRILGKMVGYYYTDFGPLNQVVHMWGYQSLDDRFERRKQLQASPQWQSYAKKMRPLVVKVENKLLVPAPFFKVPD
ncbi:NIPSNAP family protein [Afipia felis]